MNKSIRSILRILVTFTFCSLAINAMAADARVIWQANYVLRANTPYTTGLQGVYGGLQHVGRIAIFQAGNYCKITVNDVFYVTHSGGRLLQARALGGGRYEIPEGQVAGLEMKFTQEYWDGVTCTLSVEGEGGGSPSDQVFLGVLNYSGGYSYRLPLVLSHSVVLSQFRVVVPTYCQGVDLLEAGTVTQGVFDAARAVPGSYGDFSVPFGMQRVSEINVTINGAPSRSCSLPVYGMLAGG